MMVPTDKRAPVGFAALSVIGLIVAAVVPKYTAEHPQRVNVAFRQDETGAKVLVDTGWGPAMQWGEPPDVMLRAAGAGELRVPALPWMRPAPYANVPPLPVATPSFEVASAVDDNGTRKIRGKLRSDRHAPMLVLWFPLDRHVEVKVNHRYAYPRTFATGRLLAVAASEAEIEIDASGNGPLNVELADRTFGVPPGTKAEAAVKARPVAAVAFQDGDITVVSRKLSL